MAIPTSVSDLSTTASSNSPSGSDSPTQLDDFIRAHASIIRQVSDSQTSALSSGLAGKASAGLATASGLTVSATNKILGRSSSGSGAVEEIACTAAGRALLDDADAAAQRTTLGLVIGADVQAFDADIPTTAASQAEMEAGTETALRSMSPLRVKQAITALASTPLFSQEYISAETAIAVNTTYTFAHGFGVKPKMVQIIKKCITADGIYVPGDEVLLAPYMEYLGSGVGIEVKIDVVNINVFFGSYAVFPIRSSGSVIYATAANWKIIVKAWA